MNPLEIRGVHIEVHTAAAFRKEAISIAGHGARDGGEDVS